MPKSPQGGVEMNKYEVVVMFYPEVEEEARNSALERLKGIIEKEGTISNIDEWGMRKLAYEIEYKNEAYYVLITFEAKPAAVKEFDRVAKIMEPVMRSMIVRLDK